MALRRVSELLASGSRARTEGSPERSLWASVCSGRIRSQTRVSSMASAAPLASLGVRPRDADEGSHRDEALSDQCHVGAGSCLPETFELDLQITARDLGRGDPDLARAPRASASRTPSTSSTGRFGTLMFRHAWAAVHVRRRPLDRGDRERCRRLPEVLAVEAELQAHRESGDVETGRGERSADGSRVQDEMARCSAPG